jgi:hypothetical protein
VKSPERLNGSPILLNFAYHFAQVQRVREVENFTLDARLESLFNFLIHEVSLARLIHGGKGGNRPMGPQDHAEGAEESSSSLFTVSP